MPGESPWRGVRYTTLVNSWGPGGALVERPGRLYEARLVVLTAATGVAYLYDHTRSPQNLHALLNAGGGLPDHWPAQPVHLPFDRGLYVSFSMGTGVMAIQIAWDRA